VILAFQKSSQFLRRILDVHSSLKVHFWPVDRPDLRLRVVIVIALMMIGKGFTVMLPMVYKWATNFLIDHPASSTPGFHLTVIALSFVAAYGGVRILALAANQVRDGIFAKVGQNAVRTLINLTFQNVHRLSLRFHLQRHTGGLSRIIARGATGIETIVRTVVLSGVPTIIEFILTISMIAYVYSLQYVLVIFLTTVAYTWFTVTASNRRIVIRKEMNDADTDAMSKAVDSLLNYETVKYFNNEGLEARRYDAATARYEKAALNTYISLAWLNFGQSVIFTTGIMITMLMSAYEVTLGQQSTGHFVMINAFMIQLTVPLNFLGTIYREISQGTMDTLAMFELLSEVPDLGDKENAPAIAINSGGIIFDRVSFAYDPDRPILQDLSFEVKPGQTVAIVGPSGAGKSTILRLLFRFYDVDIGSISIDGQDIRDVTTNSLRRSIGIVPQDTVLFNESIGYNLQYGQPTASQEEIDSAAQKAQIADFIASLPEGYDTRVGERGVKLSGGEKQRVAIARTMLKDPRILILDEATSALDSQTEKEIQDSLSELSKQRTTLVIAHRLSTVVNADQILVLKGGKIQECGRHRELINKNGIYAAMWDRQRAAQKARDQLEKAIIAERAIGN